MFASEALLPTEPSPRHLETNILEDCNLLAEGKKLFVLPIDFTEVLNIN